MNRAERGRGEAVVGLCTIDLQVPASQSLKQKRQVVRGIVARLRNEFNVSVAEVEHQDSWQLATLAVAAVSGDANYVHGLLERVARWIQNGRLDVVLLDYRIEFL